MTIRRNIRDLVFIASAALACFAASLPRARAAEYHNDANGYTLTISDDWAKVPDDLAQKVEAAMSPDPTKRVHYDAVFQRKGQLAMTPPLIVLQCIATGPVAESQFDDFIRGITVGFDQAAQQHSGDLAKQGLNSWTLDPVKMDAPHHSFTFGATLKGNAGSLHIGSSGRFGAQTTTQVMYVDATDKFDKYAADRDAIMASLHYDPARDFVPGQGERKFFDTSSPEKLGESIGKLVGPILVVAGIIWFIQSRRKSKPPVPPAPPFGPTSG